MKEKVYDCKTVCCFRLMFAIAFVVICVWIFMSCCSEAKAANAGADFISPNAQKVVDQIDNGLYNNKQVETYEVDRDEIDRLGFRNAVQNKLDIAKGGTAAGSSGNIIYRIVVPSGNYSLDSGSLCIYSNTILDLRGSANGIKYYDESVKINCSTENGCILRCGDSQVSKQGSSGYENITILGGTFIGKNKDSDKTGVTGCNIRFGHMKNLNLIGIRVKDNCGGHHVELGGVDKVLVANCSFVGFNNPSDAGNDEGKLSIEAVQLDVVHRDKKNFAGYPKYDDTPVTNATIEYNSFENVQRGVGSHHAVISKGNASTYKNIKINNNLFKNIPDRAISAEYFSNSEIAYNYMQNVNSGINVSNMIKNQFYMVNKSGSNYSSATTKDLSLNVNTKIHHNTIKIRSDLIPWKNHATVKYGIKAGGENINSIIKESASLNPNANRNGLPKGTYYVTGLDVYNNSITGLSGNKKNIDFGIFVSYAKNCKFRNNSINLNGMDASTGNGFGIRENYSYNLTVSGNTISGLKRNYSAGVAVGKGVVGGAISGNKVYSVSGSGIKIHENGRVGNISSNNIQGGTLADPVMIVNGAVTGSISKNTIKGNSQAKNAIVISGSPCVNGGITGNTISGKNQIGIKLSKGSIVKFITNNKIFSTKTSSVFMEGASVKGAISKNTITGTKTNFGLNLNKAKSVGAIIVSTGNSIKSMKKGNMIVLPKKTIVLCKNHIVKKKKKVKIGSGAKAKWTVSNKKLATIKSGILKAKKKSGRVVVTCKAGNVRFKTNVTIK